MTFRTNWRDLARKPFPFSAKLVRLRSIAMGCSQNERPALETKVNAKFRAAIQTDLQWQCCLPELIFFLGALHYYIIDGNFLEFVIFTNKEGGGGGGQRTARPQLHAPKRPSWEAPVSFLAEGKGRRRGGGEFNCPTPTSGFFFAQSAALRWAIVCERAVISMELRRQGTNDSVSSRVQWTHYMQRSNRDHFEQKHTECIVLIWRFNEFW